MIAKVEKQSKDIDLIKIDNEETKIVFSNYGARIVSWKFDDNLIVLGNVVEADEFYFENPFKFGATVGRYGGRIANATFELDGKTYELPKNDGENNLHGGPNGLDDRFFDYEIKEQVGQIQIVFKTQIKNKDDYFPGDIQLEVIHTYDVNHRWTIEYKATASETTLFNPMNHVYFNLNRDNKVVDNHFISSEALKMYPLAENNIVTDTTPIDLINVYESDKVQLKDIFESDYPEIKQQMAQFGGLDHPFDIHNGYMTIENDHFMLSVETDMPNVVMFTFNHPKSWESDFNIYKPHSGFTLETQCMPNDINLYGDQASSILKANSPFYSKTVFQINEK
ncbi:aldose epimerase family protein [Staphylococcus sp. Marseille-Q6910]|uniref:aldose epimerase family protein n=1 Tax=Staphylococcus sp. Marseille-Q6910 TaxID=2937990 RepID=UPI00203C293E|nr:aldose epimerase family protein [Staphylococcus sp. Marseille-Q6910]